MVVARLHRFTDAESGKPYLAGTTRYDLPRGSMIVLRRDGEDYVIVAANDKRQPGDRSQGSLSSFLEPDSK